MKFGVCCSAKEAKLVKQAGYDYVEPVFSKITTMSEEEFNETRETLEKCGIPAEAYNGFFPSTKKLYTDYTDDTLREYCETGFSRAKLLGGKIVVLGSGGPRRIPEGADPEAIKEHFIRFARIIGDVADKYDITVAIEPLNWKESNFINTVEDGLEICKQINHKRIKCLADFYHVFVNGESLAAIQTAGSMLAHVHLARANEDRAMPTEQDAETCEAWASALKQCGYNARISLEGRHTPDFETSIRNVKECLELFK